jgi:hypothetical protein
LFAAPQSLDKGVLRQIPSVGHVPHDPMDLQVDSAQVLVDKSSPPFQKRRVECD